MSEAELDILYDPELLAVYLDMYTSEAAILSDLCRNAELSADQADTLLKLLGAGIRGGAVAGDRVLYTLMDLIAGNPNYRSSLPKRESESARERQARIRAEAEESLRRLANAEPVPISYPKPDGGFFHGVIHADGRIVETEAPEMPEITAGTSGGELPDFDVQAGNDANVSSDPFADR